MTLALSSCNQFSKHDWSSKLQSIDVEASEKDAKITIKNSVSAETNALALDVILTFKQDLEESDIYRGEFQITYFIEEDGSKSSQQGKIVAEYNQKTKNFHLTPEGYIHPETWYLSRKLK